MIYIMYLHHIFREILIFSMFAIDLHKNTIVNPPIFHHEIPII